MAWLYVPGGEGWNLGSPSPSETPTAPSVLSNGKSMPPASWSRAWKKGGYIRLLSGTIYPPLTADAGVAAWISSLRDSPVSPSAQPGSDRPTTIADTSGRTSGGLSTGRDRLSSFWRTSEHLFQLDNGTGDRPTWWSETSWSDWVTELRRRSSAHQTWGHHISGSASSSWATPVVSDTTGACPGRTDLRTQVNHWGTPRVSMAKHQTAPIDRGQGKIEEQAVAWRAPKQWQTPKVATGAYSYPSGDKTRPFLNLEGQAETFHLDPETPTLGPPSLPSAPNSHQLWYTPRVQQGDQTRGNTTDPYGLVQQATREVNETSNRLWQTPQAFRDTGETLSEWRDRNARKKAENENLGSLQLSLATQARGDHKKMRLNPLFVEWLMGWPEQWSTARSDSDSSAMAWCHWLRRSRSALARMHSALR